MAVAVACLRTRRVPRLARYVDGGKTGGGLTMASRSRLWEKKVLIPISLLPPVFWCWQIVMVNGQAVMLVPVETGAVGQAPMGSLYGCLCLGGCG